MEDKEQVTENKHLTKEEATAFFSEFYHGEHHIPRGGIKEYGDGWVVVHMGSLATFDYDELTRLVIAAHEKCIRVCVMPFKFKEIKIAIWKRQREGGMSKCHPTLEQAIEKFRAKG